MIVTGAGRGTGQFIAKLFLKRGAFVAATDLTVPTWETEYEERLLRINCDVASEEAVINMVETVRKKFGCVNILINNAGIAFSKPLIKCTLQEWQNVFSVNMVGQFLCAREVARNIIADGVEGRIINISSIAGRNAFSNNSAYSASKAAVIGFTRALALELGPEDITVNAICPGSVDTPMLQKVMDNISRRTGLDIDEVKTNMASNIPMRRLQTAEDIAELCYFLASDAAKNINGESINLDGGMVRC